MRTLLLAPALALPLLVLMPAPAAHADPLICVDPGPTHVGDITVDLPEVCVL